MQNLQCVVEIVLYRSIVGPFQYITFSTLEISYTLNKVSPFMKQLLLQYWKFIKRVFR